LGCSLAAGESSEIQKKHQPSETRPEKLLGDDQPRTNGAIGQWFKALLFVTDSHDGHIEDRFR